MLNIFDLQKELVAAALPSGLEDRQAEVIKKYATHYCDEMYTDGVGNLICHKKGPGKKLMLVAHMDVIGFMVNHIDERGFVRFVPVGGISPALSIGCPVVFENGVFGCVQPDEKAKPGSTALSKVEMHHMYIDIGAKDKADAEKLVKIGMYATYCATPKKLAGGNIMTPYADNLASCAVLLSAMSEINYPANDLYYVFSVQEEVGCRGAKMAANAIKPYAGIAIDLTRTGDSPAELDNERMVVKLGAGPAIKIRDSSAICDKPVVEHLRACAEKADIAYQDEVLISGGTDTSAMQRSYEGVLSGCISIPGRNIHSPGEIINLSDADNAAKLLVHAAMTEI